MLVPCVDTSITQHTYNACSKLATYKLSGVMYVLLSQYKHYQYSGVILIKDTEKYRIENI